MAALLSAAAQDPGLNIPSYFEFVDHPDPEVNKCPFAPSSDNPTANGKVHFSNGRFHLYFKEDCWMLSSKFTPESNACNSYIDHSPAFEFVAEGVSVWKVIVAGAWKDVPVKVTRLSAADIAARELAARRLIEGQAAGALQFKNHPIDSVNSTPFIIAPPPSSSANSLPHWFNGSFHLYSSSDGTWMLSANFTPESGACNSYIAHPVNRLVPEGLNIWKVSQSGAWTDLALVVTHLTPADLAAAASAATNALEAQGSSALHFASHPNEHVNFPPFKRLLENSSANGKPAFTNGQYFLYFEVKNKTWLISNSFTPDSPTCITYTTAIGEHGTVPEGSSAWQVIESGEWKEVSVTITRKPLVHTVDYPAFDIVNRYLVAKQDEKRFLKADPFDEIQRICEQKNARFVDSHFPPKVDSVMLEGDMVIDKVSWIRWSDLRENPIVFDSSFADDVKQGSLGNCYLCSIMANLAVSRPDLLRAVFCGRSTQSSSGCYTLRLCDPRSKEWVYVVVDDFVAVRGGNPVFMTSRNESEMWCSLIEKAFAKLAGSYARLDASLQPMKPIITRAGTEEIMEMLTGGVGLCRTVKCGAVGEEEVWQSILYACEKKWPITTSCKDAINQAKGGKAKDQDEETGLVHHHSYSIVGALMMPCGDRLVRVRNPWGSFEWSGKWCDHDSKSWTPENVAYVSRSKTGGGPYTNSEDDGVFFLSLVDYVANFGSVQFCPVVGDSTWAEHTRRFEKAVEDQASGALDIQGHPDGDIGASLFYRVQPDGNGKPHYQNGVFHIFFSDDKDWKVSTNFTPDSGACNSFFEQNFLGLIPEGDVKWSIFSNNVWKDVVVRVTHLSSADLERRRKATQAALDEQARGELEFSAHPNPHVNATRFRRCAKTPEANEHPHFENGAYHLFFSGGKWRISSGFDPQSTRCSNSISPEKPFGTVPVGEHVWDHYDEKANGWVDIHLMVKHHSK